MFMCDFIFSFSDKATNPSNRQEDWEFIMGFCDQINKELEGYGHVHLITPEAPINIESHPQSNPRHLCLKHAGLCISCVTEFELHCLNDLSAIIFSPQISVRLLAYKIQSPQEWEAMQALTVSGEIISLGLDSEVQQKGYLFAFVLQVLEACMKNCGRRFHNEVGKFKFLNELIKVVSPKVSNKCLKPLWEDVIL